MILSPTSEYWTLYFKIITFVENTVSYAFADFQFVTHVSGTNPNRNGVTCLPWRIELSTHFEKQLPDKRNESIFRDGHFETANVWLSRKVPWTSRNGLWSLRSRVCALGVFRSTDRPLNPPDGSSKSYFRICDTRLCIDLPPRSCLNSLSLFVMMNNISCI